MKRTFINRELLRRRSSGRTLAIPTHLKAIRAAIPTPPAVFSWTKGRSIQYPILGNDTVGDCYYAAALHKVQTDTGNNGAQAEFDAQAVISRYEQISGGDNGLGDAQIYPEWKAGLLGPNGPHKILDDMTVRPDDAAGIALAMFAFGGVLWTASLPDAWVQDENPGTTWDAATPDPNNGHAMFLSGKNAKGGYDLETWGFTQPINLTQAGLESADPEVIAVFSMEWFDKSGRAPNGLHYADLAPLWTSLGGIQLPANPFPAPAPTPPPHPTPVPPKPTPSPLPAAVVAAVDARLRLDGKRFWQIALWQSYIYSLARAGKSVSYIVKDVESRMLV